jgi:hypothetical protein
LNTAHRGLAALTVHAAAERAPICSPAKSARHSSRCVPSGVCLGWSWSWMRRVRRHLEDHDLDDTAQKLISGQLLGGESSAI